MNIAKRILTSKSVLFVVLIILYLVLSELLRHIEMKKE